MKPSNFLRENNIVSATRNNSREGGLGRFIILPIVFREKAPCPNKHVFENFLFVSYLKMKTFHFFEEISSVQNKVPIFAKTRVSEGGVIYEFHEGFFTLNLLAPK